ncbi:MAG TPA: carboxypeptidase-like regulatory domain-containing protein [Candidatus Limnocylindrales bacterium]|nr:carboxypeptidase-like regulatory domain-containing protein [Candidatus Limnocylindrales bacterium]
MSAIDGYFDASNGGWENISGSIDTLKLTSGTYTVYVRGMDIGKQWSTTVTAMLIVLESRGFVNGTIKNNTGAGIPGATVMTDTGVSADTDSMGFYSLNLTIGTYNLKATKDPEYFTNITIPSVTVKAFITEPCDVIMVKKPTGTINGTVKNS